MAQMISRTMMKGKGRGGMTVGDLRVLVSALDDVPHDYEVLVFCEEMDMSLITEAKVELGENRSDDGPGWVMFELKEAVA